MKYNWNRKRIDLRKIRIFHTNAIFKQLLLFTAIISLVPIILISAISLDIIDEIVTDELVTSHSQFVTEYTTNTNDKLYQYKESLTQIANNTIVLNTLMGESDNNPYINGKVVSIEVNKSLRLQNHVELQNCIIYSNVKESPIYGTRVTMVDSAKNETWYLDGQVLTNDYFIYSAINKKSNILSLIKNIDDIDTNNFKVHNIGFIKLDVSIDKLFEPLKNSSDYSYQYDVIVLDDNDKIVYSSNELYNNVFTKLTIEELRETEINYYNDKIVCGDTIDEYKLKLYFVFDNSELINKKIEMKKTILPFILIILCIIVITSYSFTKSFSARIARLVNKIKQAETGDLTITEEIGGNDEIAILDKQFNHMLKKLDHLIKKNYIQQLEKKESEFRNLQLQINPHFLYNTLETISSIAAVNKTFTICNLCEKLGDIFRYSLGKDYGGLVTIEQELQYTKNYLYIQETRYINKFEVFYNIEPELKSRKILRFILQPIVENAVVHGISNLTRKGTLEISICQDNDKLVIKIADDGLGMTKEKVEELTRYINQENDRADESRKSIGIRNVNQRIKLAYGNDFGITIESALNQGSCFTIWLPLT